jgi:regulator of chromosome condensation
MAPRKATTAKVEPNAAKKRASAADTKQAATTKKRKPDEDDAEPPPAKRGRPSKPTASAETNGIAHSNGNTTNSKVDKAAKAAATSKASKVQTATKDVKSIKATETSDNNTKLVENIRNGALAKGHTISNGDTKPGKSTTTKSSSAAKKTDTKTEQSSAAPKAAANNKTSKNTAAVNKSKATKASKSPEPLAPKATKVTKPAAATRKPKRSTLNLPAPSTVLEVFAVGEGSAGELGLGTKNATEVTRFRRNVNLDPKTVGVVEVSTGGMHAAALTRDNKVLTWGINDEGALGRDTAWEGGMKDIADAREDEDSDDDASESDLNPKECIPTAIPADMFPPGTKIVQVAAGDSTTFALTDEGLVYGWGTFRVSFYSSHQWPLARD